MKGAAALVWTLAGRFLLLVLGVLVGALVNRALSPAGRGIYAEVQTWVGLFIALFGCSLDTATYHFANRERYPVADGVRLTLTTAASLTVSALGAGAMRLTMEVAPQRFSAEAREHFFTIALLLTSTVLSTNLVTLNQALARVRFAAVLGLVQGGLSAAVVGLAFLTKSVTVWFALSATTIVQLVVATIAVTAGASRDGFRAAGLERSMVQRYVSAGLKQHVATISTFLYSRVNQLIVFHFCGDKHTGFLAASLTLALGMFSGFSALQFALYPRVIHSTDDFEVTIRSLRIAFYLGLAAVLPLVLLGGPILRAYGGEAFEPAALSFRLLVPGAWFLSMSSLVSPYYIKRGAFGLAAASAVALGVLSVALNLFLVPAYASVGAAAATMTTMMVGFGLALTMLAVIARRSPLAVFVPDFRVELRALRDVLRRFRGQTPPM